MATTRIPFLLETSSNGLKKQQLLEIGTRNDNVQSSSSYCKPSPSWKDNMNPATDNWDAYKSKFLHFFEPRCTVWLNWISPRFLRTSVPTCQTHLWRYGWRWHHEPSQTGLGTGPSEWWSHQEIRCHQESLLRPSHTLPSSCSSADSTLKSTAKVMESTPEMLMKVILITDQKGHHKRNNKLLAIAQEENPEDGEEAGLNAVSVK